MKTNTLCYTAALLMSLNFSLHAMDDDIEAPRNAALVTTAHFTGPIRMVDPRINVDASRETTTFIQQYSNRDYTKGDPNTTWVRKVANAASDGVLDLVCGAPSHIVSSLAVQVLTPIIIGWITGGRTSELVQLNNIELFVGYLTKQSAALSVSSEEYKQKKAQIGELLKQQRILEDSLYKKLTSDQTNKTVGSIVVHFLYRTLRLDATMNNLRYIGNGLAPVSA